MVGGIGQSVGVGEIEYLIDFQILRFALDSALQRSDDNMGGQPPMAPS